VAQLCIPIHRYVHSPLWIYWVVSHFCFSGSVLSVTQSSNAGFPKLHPGAPWVHIYVFAQLIQIEDSGYGAWLTEITCSNKCGDEGGFLSTSPDKGSGWGMVEA
jgi:hypothetical protein